MPFGEMDGKSQRDWVTPGPPTAQAQGQIPRGTGCRLETPRVPQRDPLISPASTQ